jgi:hypothetical protein
MSININNGVANVLNTPAAYSGDFASAPVATGVPVGTLWFDYVNGVIYQSDGTTWQGLGGSGGAQDLQQTCNVGNTVTQTNDILTLGPNIITGTFGLNVNDIAVNTQLFLTSTIINISDLSNAMQIGANYLQFTQAGNTSAINCPSAYILETLFSTNAFGLKIDANNGNCFLGDHANQIKGDFLEIDNTNEWIKTKMSNNEFGLFVDRTVGTWIGDFNGIGNNTYIEIDDVTQSIDGGNSLGARFELGGGRVKIGDTQTVVNGSIFGIDDGAQQLIASTNLLTGTASGASGQHLKIRVGSTNYVIDLKNP